MILVARFLPAIAVALCEPATYAAGETPGTNLWAYSGMSKGNRERVLVPNDGLNAIGLDGYVAQQVSLNPFVAIQSFIDQNGSHTIRMTNGLPSFSKISLGRGKKVFDVGPGMNFTTGIDVTAADADDPIHRKMSGRVVSYQGSRLTLNVTSVTGFGSVSKWALGRVGVTKQAQTKLVTNALTRAGSNVLYFPSTSGVQIGSAVEVGQRPLPKAPYVVSKTATAVMISGTAKEAMPAGTPITFYGDQGYIIYQDIGPAQGSAFRFGTPQARSARLAFVVRSRFVSGTASVIFLGYNSLASLGRSLAVGFPVTKTEAKRTVNLPGDTVATPGTWTSSSGHPWAALGFSWESQGTKTSRNIPSGRWSSTFAVAGVQKQTFQLSSVVGAWVEVSDIHLQLTGQPQ